jgi:serine/threonine protein kinase/tetratricopeptide (TPR) repeat protein
MRQRECLWRRAEYGTPLAQAQTAMNSPQVGDRLAQYELLEAIGAGGMGRVFRARDARLDRDVALKVLSPELAADPVMRARFEREARSIAALTHPGIVSIHELAVFEGAPIIVMELLEGMNLRQRLEAGFLPCRKTMEILTEVAEALAAAHAVGIVHRDLKPDNVFITKSGGVKLLDFGLARRSVGPCDTSDLTLTAPRMLVGTLRYMSPEQARGETPTVASDVFSLGLLLYELTTGHRAFEADSVVGLLHAVVHDAPIAPSRLNSAISPELEGLTLQMLAKHHADRPAAAGVAARLRGMTSEPRAAVPPPVQLNVRRHTVGRATERDALRSAWSAACAGQSSLVTIAGEPGIGKTTLIEDFLVDVAASETPSLIGRGRCSETLAATEAYLPILEALETLVRSGGEPVQRVLKQLAPTWHLQIAPLTLEDSSAERIRQEIRSASPQRVKREIRAFLQEVSRQTVIALFLDDVHWADPATVDLLAYLARGFGDMRLLLVTTHRVSELLLSGHALASLLLDLQAKGVARELLLPFLEHVDVERYLELEFSGHEFPDAFARLVHTRTEGSPLFMVDMLADLRNRGVIRSDPEWHLADDVPAIERELPASVRSMIQRRLDHVRDEDVRLLRIASVQGNNFDATVVADAAELTVVEVEERLDTLARVHSLVRLVEERELPDGTITARYQFVHVLYQNALHASLTPARRSALSAAVARSLQTHYGPQLGPVASRIAFLFEAAREFRLAAHAYGVAAEHAAQLVAHREAATLARRGLTALHHLPETPERTDIELTLLVSLGVALQITEGYISAEGRRTYLRARDLCRALGNRPELFPSLWGLWMFSICTGDFDAAVDLANELVTMAATGRPQDRVRAAWARGTTSLHRGSPIDALQHFERGLESYREEDDRVDRHLYGHDAGITCRAFGGWARWFVGQSDEAVADVEAACDVAAKLSHPQSFAFALIIAGNVHQGRGDEERTLVRATEARGLAEREGLPQFLEWSRCQVGWALARRGSIDEGYAMVTDALQALSQIGSAVGQPYFSAARAEIFATTRPAEALEVIDDALDQSRSSGERMYDAELLRLKAVALGARGDADSAERFVDEAIEVARAQGAAALLQRARATCLEIHAKQTC